MCVTLEIWQGLATDAGLCSAHVCTNVSFVKVWSLQSIKVQKVVGPWFVFLGQVVWAKSAWARNYLIHFVVQQEKVTNIHALEAKQL